MVSLQDNMAFQGAACKWCSPAGSLNHLLRQKAGARLASNVRLVMPWVESEKQPADELPRLLDYGFGSAGGR